MSKIKAQMAFLKEVEKLKCITRVNKTLEGRGETSAEHAWHVALMALLLGEYARSDIDLLKVVKLLLIHDIVEIDAGDTWIFEDDQSEKLKAESEAADRIFSLLPEAQKVEYLGLWEEYEAQISEESKFALVMDGIQPLLNHLITGQPKDGTVSVEKVLSKKAYVQKYTPELWSLVESLVSSSAEKGLYV